MALARDKETAFKQNMSSNPVEIRYWMCDINPDFKRPQLHGVLTLILFENRFVLVSLRRVDCAGISMASQQPTAGSAPKTLLVRGRLKTPGQMKAFVHDAVGLHLLGQYPYKNKDDSRRGSTTSWCARM